MKKIRIKIVAPSGRVDTILRILRKYYEVELCEKNPDYLIDSSLRSTHVWYDCVKIQVIGENFVTDFNEFDYAIGFDPINFGDRFLTMPLFPYSEEFKELDQRKFPAPEALLNREFCSFVVSRGEKDPTRVEFFRQLSKYKPVASGGRFMNNVGGPVADKLAFCAKYKFNIAFENSKVPGYTTEKIMEPLTVNSVPIYYGDPLIADYFHPDCMVHVANRDDFERAIEEIIALDRDDEAYLRKVMAPASVHDSAWYEQRLTDFLRNIFDQPLTSARRTCPIGHQEKLRRHARRQACMDLVLSPHKWAKTLKRGLGLAR